MFRLIQLQFRAAQNVRLCGGVAHPDLLAGQHRLVLAFRLLFDRFFCLRLRILENRFEVSACLPHAQRDRVRAKLAADAHRGGKSIIQAFLFRFLRQLRGNFCGRAVNAELSTVHDQHPVADGKDRVQPMFGQQHRHAELPVDALDGVQ